MPCDWREADHATLSRSERVYVFLALLVELRIDLGKRLAAPTVQSVYGEVIVRSGVIP